MKKVRMIVEMDEELYKAFAEQDVFISGMRTGKTLLSEIWKALKNATIVRMSEEKIKESCSLSLVYNEGFDKGYEKAKAEYESMLDKTRAEIEQEITYKPMEMWDYRMGLTKALDIINKCKSESEVSA